MHLKKLQLAGFKTFADKTEIEFGDGLTAIVGPNGCGKSNLADALLWVMGEQNPRLLRGGESRDVIFSGTDKRKPLGMAEVKLTLDNADYGLPLNFAEVTVTRRIYRSGESVYLLNGAPCRLKDIADMFMDTGVGRDAYSFVSQSEIDAVLSSRPEDRRELFEEAAGIKKYRVKKREAVRKLEQAEANLTRIRDIISELDRQRAPLEKQAEIAGRYLGLSDRLQQIEVDLLVADVKKTDYELYAERREQTLSQEALANFDAELGILERESEFVGELLAEAEKELDNARMAQQSALTTLERTENKLQIVGERGKSAEQNAETLDEELKELAARASTLNREIEAQTNALQKMESVENQRKQDLDAAKTKLKEFEKELGVAVRASEDRQGMLKRLADQRAHRESALAACESRLSETDARITKVNLELSDLVEQREEAEVKLEQAGVELTARKDEIVSLLALHTELKNKREVELDLKSQLQTKLDAARRLMVERSSRLSTLSELQESGEGFYQGVRSVLRAQKDGKLTGRYAPVVDILTVPEELRVAIEVALGSSAQDIVCETERDARAAIEWLKALRAGRATFLALPLLRPGQTLSQSAVKGPGIIGVAASLVKADPNYKPVMELLLGRVVLVEDMDAAVDAANRLTGWNRIVTLEGELMTPGGALTGGSLQGRSAHLVGRKGEIDDLNRELPLLKSNMDGLAMQSERCNRRIEKLDGELAERNRCISENQASCAGMERDVRSLERDLDRLKRSCMDMEGEAKRLSAMSRELACESEKWARAVKEGKAEDIDVDDAIAAAQEEVKRLAKLRDDSRSTVVSLEIETGKLMEKKTGLKRSLASVQEALKQVRASQMVKQAHREQVGSLFADADQMRRELEGEIEKARVQLSICEEQYVVWRDKRQILLNESFGKQSAIKELSKERGDTAQQIHDSELQVARLEVKLSQTAQRMLDEYGITMEDALSRPDPGEMARETVNEIARLRREIRQMGQVNTGAVEEYQRLAERLEFLSTQRADLEAARSSLADTISEIDAGTRENFLSTFRAVSDEFARLFQRLFGGGSTNLVLTNPEDLMETGIEVMAQPPGKKQQHLSLLSGGERALTAVALMFSFLSVRPSPFVLLDEVDAPLDGSNVDKFVRLVKEFAGNTQFLIITHNPTTMEAAPRWYGVTMQEPGISKLLSYRLPPEALESEPDLGILPEQRGTAKPSSRL